MRRLSALFALAALHLTTAERQIPEENGILTLTDETLPKALASHSKLLVKFYAPWCGACRALQPEYVKAAAQLRIRNSDVRLAKLDVTAHERVGVEQGITGVPTLRLFSDGKRQADYKGPKEAQSVVDWLKRKSNPAALTIATAAELDILKRDHFAVVGFFKDVDSAAARAFLACAEDHDGDAKFAIASSDGLFAACGVAGPQGVLLFEPYDDVGVERGGGGGGGVEFGGGEYTTEALSAFVRQRTESLVVDVTALSMLQLFSGRGRKTLLLLFIGKSSDGYGRAMRTAAKVATKYRGKIQFAAVDTDSDYGAILTSQFWLRKRELPAYRLVTIDGDSAVQLYKPDGKPEVDDEPQLASFIARYVAGELRPQLLSQELPADWDARPVKVLVGTNYDGVTRGSGKRVVVMLHTPQHRRCKQLAPIWDQLGEHYRDSTDLIVAKFDAKSNEASGLQVTAYPLIKLYLPGRSKETDYAGEMTLEELTKFIDLNGADAASLGVPPQEAKNEALPEAQDSRSGQRPGEGAERLQHSEL